MTAPTRTKKLGEYRQSTDGSERPGFGWLSARGFGCSLMRMGFFVDLHFRRRMFRRFESSGVSRAAFKCDDNSDCRGGFICIGGVCAAPDPSFGCFGDEDCGSNQTCANNVCVPAPEPSYLSCESIEVSTCQQEELLTDLCESVNSMSETPFEDPDPLTLLCDVFPGCPPLARCETFSDQSLLFVT